MIGSLEGQKTELVLSASDENVSILSHDSPQQIIAKLQAGGGISKHVMCIFQNVNGAQNINQT